MNNRKNGMDGEEKAINYLQKIGYRILDRDQHCGAYDLLVTKDNRLFAVNVKTCAGDKGVFAIQASNIPRLKEKCAELNATVAYLLINDNGVIMLTPEDDIFTWKSNKDKLIESGILCDNGAFAAQILKKNRIRILPVIRKGFCIVDGDYIKIQIWKGDSIKKEFISQMVGEGAITIPTKILHDLTVLMGDVINANVINKCVLRLVPPQAQSSCFVRTSKMAKNGRVALVSDVRETLGVSAGAIIVFCKNDDGEIVIRKGTVEVD